MLTSAAAPVIPCLIDGSAINTTECGSRGDSDRTLELLTVLVAVTVFMRSASRRVTSQSGILQLYHGCVHSEEPTVDSVNNRYQ